MLLVGNYGDNVLDNGIAAYLVHILGNFRHKGAFKAAVDIYSAVVVNKHARVDEPAVTAYLIGNGVFIFAQELERTLGTVAYAYAACGVDDIGI